MVKFKDLESIISKERMNKYMIACANNKRKAVRLYKLNKALSSYLFNIISLFELSLRNAIDKEMNQLFGSNWIATTFSFGIFSDVEKGFYTLNSALNGLKEKGKSFSNHNLVSGVSFGFWRYMFQNDKTDKIFEAIIKLLLDKCNDADNTWFINLMRDISPMMGGNKLQLFTYVVEQLDPQKLNNYDNDHIITSLISQVLQHYNVGINTINDDALLDNVIESTKLINELKEILKKNLNPDNQNNKRDLCLGISRLLQNNLIPQSCSMFKRIIYDDKSWIKNFWIYGVFPNMPEKDSYGKYITNSTVGNDVKKYQMCVIALHI